MKIKVSDYVAGFLSDNGIKHVFSVTGGGAMHLNDSLGKNEKLTVVYNHHEQACAIAAESYARIDNKIAAVCVTSGPGGTNALTGVLGAWLDSLPMFVISGQVKYETTVRSTDLKLRQLGDQEFDITKCAESMTKYAVMVETPESIRYHLEKALYLATEGRRGPVWLDIPLNVQGAIIETDGLEGFVKPKTEIALKESDIKRTVEQIKKAKRPVVLAGSGIRFSGSKDKFIKLIEKLNIPVVTAWGSHDLIWNDHPLYFGRPGTIGDRAGNFIVQNADLVIVLGCRLNIRQISYNWKNFAENAYKIVVEIDETELKKPTISPDLPVHANVADFIDALLGQKTEYSAPEKWLAYCRRMKEKYDVTDGLTLNDKYANPYLFFREVTKHSDEDRIFAAANGSACVILHQAGFFKKNHRVLVNSGCASMGYDLPAAIGAYYASGERIACFAGDGSIMMNLQELQTIISNNMDIVIYLINNAGYISIRQTQNSFFGSLHGADASSGVTLPDFEKVAHAFGYKYFSIKTNGDILPVIKKAEKQKGPVFCEVFVDPEQSFVPKLSSKKLDDGTMVSSPLQDMFPFLERSEYEENMKISKGE